MAPCFSKSIGTSNMSCEECWLTLAEDDTSAVKALVLAKCLRRVVTTRKIAVVICDNVSDSYRKILQTNFDQCLKLDMPFERNGVPLSYYVKMFCWSLPFMKKCVFLDNEALILKNCDELFDFQGTAAYLNPTAKTLETSVLVFEPSFDDYLNLCDWMRTGKLHTLDWTHEFGQWIMKRKHFRELPLSYNVEINLDDGCSAWNNSDLRIVRFTGSHPMQMVAVNGKLEKSLNTLEKALLKYWKDTYYQDVLTIVQNPTQMNGPIFQKTNPHALPHIPQRILDANKEPIAIVGMSCRFPQADNLNEYWDILANGKDCIRKVPDHRWPSAAPTDEFREVQAGFLKCPVDEFDGKFFNISPYELTHTDPQQRFLLEVSWEALEHAGINPQSLAGSNTGVFVGTWTQDYRDLIRHINGEYNDFHRTYMGNSMGGTSGRLSFLLGLTGPNIASESGCSSGMVAVYMACESLRKRRSDIALAAGANLLLHPFEKRHMVNVASPDGRCKTFDEKADGFGRAEGVATLVLKRYSDAVKAGDNIWGLIRGCGIAQEGTSRSFGTPTKEVQEIAMQAALDDAGVSPSEVSYVEAHGTGTVIGDTTEMAAITNLYCANGREKKLFVASGKTNIGHTESCSGLAGIIKVILAMHHDTIPPHINLHNLNPHINLDNVPVRIPTSSEKWERGPEGPRIAGISSFGITGTNAHVILQEPPNYQPPQLEMPTEKRPLHILTLSGKSESNLDDVVDTYLKFIEENPKSRVADLAYSCNTGRAHLPHRVAVCAGSTSELQQKLRTASKQKHHVSDCRRPKICFLFTGQGSQYHGMVKTLYDSSPVFRMHFDNCAQILQAHHGISIRDALWSSNKELLHRSLYSQTSIFSVEYSLTKLWESWGIRPDAVVGHSLGEFAAAVSAGILSFEDALTLVATRSRLIEEKAPAGQMIVVKAGKEKAESVLKQFLSHSPTNFWLDYAATNSPEQTVLAGPPKVVQAFASKCEKEGLKTHILDATNAFHSRDMGSMLSEYKEVAAKMKYSSPHCTYISGVTGKVLQDAEMNSEYWIRHTREAVQYMQASKVAGEQGFKLFLEIGPQPVLCALTMANSMEGDELPTLVPSLRKTENEWTTLLGSLAKLYTMGFDIDWVGFDQFYNRRKIPIPTTPFSRKKHWYESKGNKKGMLFNGNSIHPLLGCQIPNATSSSIFHSSLELEKVGYLKDHAIGGQIVFPGAGYLDMCLTSGCLTTTRQLELVNPMSVENLTIEAPLGLADGVPCSLQTIVSKEDGADDTKISIYKQVVNNEEEDAGKWIRQATGSFVPLQVNYRLKEQVADLRDVRERCQLEVETDEFYEKLKTVGLEFGPGFKSLKKLMRNSNGREILTEIHLDDQTTSYMCHPIVLDALIQTIMIGIGYGNNGSLYVPIVIGKVIIFSKNNSGAYYAHCSWEENQSHETRSATLYDTDGKIVAVMSGVQMIETTADIIVKNLTSRNLSIPMYEEVWRPKMGPMKNRVDLPEMLGEHIYSQSFAEELNYCNELTGSLTNLIQNRRQLVYYFVLKAFYELGWEPKRNEELTVTDFSLKRRILPSYDKLINRYFTILREEGILRQGSGKWKIIRVPPALPDVLNGISDGVAAYKNSPEETADGRVTIECGQRLASFLSGKESALSFLFPEDKTSEISAEIFYNQSIIGDRSHVALEAIIKNIAENYCRLPEEQRGVIRLLEIGAGTGSATKHVLPIFDELKVKFHYTYTDISPAFFIKAQPVFESYGQKVQFKVLNIEEDPLAQGFVPNHYDMVLASNVLHATRDLIESIRNVRNLLKDKGLFLLGETLEPIREYDVVFGLLDGFWRYDDYDIRPDYPMASIDTWGSICKMQGFDRYRPVPSFGGKIGMLVIGAAASTPLSPQNNQEQLPSTSNSNPALHQAKWWLVFADSNVFPNYLRPQFDSVGRNVIMVTKGNESYDYNAERHHFQVRLNEKSDFVNIFKMIADRRLSVEGILYLWGLDREKDQLKVTTGLLFLAQMLLSEFKGLPKFTLVTEGIMPVADETAVDVGPASLIGMIRSFRTEHFNMHVRSVDLDPDEEDLALKYSELFTEFWTDDMEYQIAYRQRSRHVCRLVQSKDFANPLPLPNCERFSLVLPATKNIADLKFCPNGKAPLTGNQVDIEVRASGLNFRDVFTVLKPEKQFDSINTVGLEFSGVVLAVGPDVKRLKVGDSVMGCNFSDGALPSHLQMEESTAFKIPEGITFPEAATIPAAFATAYYCLVMVADLTKGETVLIHAGSGAVGLFAIQVANAVGANIIATAGSRRKRAFLRDLGVKHVFHSRNTDYGKQIAELTQGGGVQVVLNSLTSPGFKEASLGVTCEKGRFVEMSKLHVWSDEEVKVLRPDVQYTIVDLTTVGGDTWEGVWAAVGNYMKQGLLRPIPYTRFEASAIREALTYMQKAKHVGKIIVAMPRMTMKDSRLEPEAPLFNDASTYLITGGLGGIGLQVTKWMCGNGAKHVVLSSRRPADENALKIINELKSQGKNIVTMCIDVGDYDQCAHLFQAIQEPKLNLPRLRGVMHAAGTLSDATYVNQTVETFRTAFQGKVYGAWNLHCLTKDYLLEHFVMFSSMVSILGPVGLGNYSAANAYIDALSHYRHSLGLCAQAINWGQWGEVGAAKDVSMPAVKPFSPSQGLAALEIIMKTQKTQIAVLDVDFAYVRKLTANVGTYLEELKLSKGNQVTFTVKINSFWDEFNGCEADDKRIGVLKSYVGTILRQILKFDDDEVIDEDQNFSEMGMDSLMMLEMKNFLQTMLGKNITMNVSEMAELTTINKLANHVLLLIKKSSEDKSSNNEGKGKSSKGREGSKPRDPFSPEMKKIIEEDMVLPGSIGASGEACQPSNIRQVLLTGVTGKLGPYMLEALVRRPLDRICCLIRAQDDNQAKKRLVEALREKGLSFPKHPVKIECIPADITLPMFGLTENKYETLASRIDAVVHCAVRGNLMEPYLKPGDTTSPVRNVNVIGTRNVLEFAGRAKTKRILHASTLLACQKVSGDDLLFEDWCNPEDVFQMTNTGYPLSKFVCEILAHQANERGIPIQAHRFPGLLGDKNGCFSFPNNHAMLRLLGFCKIGAMPEFPIPLQVLDVDFAAEISCQIFFNSDASSGVYNLTNPNMNLLQEFPSLAKEFGFQIDIVEYEEFLKKLASNKELEAVIPFREVDLAEDRYVDFSFSPVAMQCWSKNPDEFFISRKINALFPNFKELTSSPIDILRRDMAYARNNGIFTKMNLL